MLELNEGNFEKETRGSKVIIDFWAPWCGPCQMMGPVFEELGKEYKGKLKFAKVNTDVEQVLAMKHSIQSIPCLVVFDNGKEVDRIVGFGGKEALKDRIDQVI